MGSFGLGQEVGEREREGEERIEGKKNQMGKGSFLSYSYPVVPLVFL